MLKQAAAAVLVGGLGLTTTACDPMELDLRVRREGTVEYTVTPATATTIHLKGRVNCTRDIHVDLFLNVAQGTTDGATQAAVDCDSSDGTRLPPFEILGHFPDPEPARVRLEACTNPSNQIDEDCITVERIVDFTAQPD